MSVYLETLPLAPRKAFRIATELGWEPQTWTWEVPVEPVLFVESSDEAGKEHNSGDVRFDGYLERTYVVQGMDPLLEIAFQAWYVGKTYEDGRSASKGAFDYARVSDPVGIPVELRADYQPIRQTRGEYETDKSFQKRRDDAQKMADEMNAAYNDGAVVMNPVYRFTTAKEFDGWLAEWKPYLKGAK